MDRVAEFSDAPGGDYRLAVLSGLRAIGSAKSTVALHAFAPLALDDGEETAALLQSGVRRLAYNASHADL